ncbi:MAG: hypothetical protein DMD78_19890 [Candidatus Rokuibacteriota bacterium]|nr:MAG: hypothetical protein DMD78_19890 [Candidatus Rokubacteria bacterium]
MSRQTTRLISTVVLTAAVAGCAGLTPEQDRGWTAFHACQSTAAPSATMEDLLVTGRVHYWTQEGVDFSAMKACMQQGGYSCDVGVTIGMRPHTYCYPKPA